MTREQDEIQRAKDDALNFVAGYLTALNGCAPTQEQRESAADALESLHAYIESAAIRAAGDSHKPPAA